MPPMKGCVIITGLLQRGNTLYWAGAIPLWLVLRYTNSEYFTWYFREVFNGSSGAFYLGAR